ncbi:GumC family protein [Rhodoplanes sp. Z2-YC6860]|uniref:GumC family protein n=1 Tax=Rhodoplanes sp. Z2-YC6860 TaxID=674703 RepID=UPI001F2040E3|nr:exopolysaccharide transport family protein [Rhodoplanes sp. Z2-YC6860]
MVSLALGFEMSLEKKRRTRSTGHDAAEDADRTTEGINLGDLAGILYRRKAWILGATTACLVLAAGYLAVVKPNYTSTAQVYFDPRDRPIPKEDAREQSSVPGDGVLLVESQLKIITSGEVLSRVVDQMGLREDPDFNGHGGFVASVKAMLGFGPSGDEGLAALRNLRAATSAKRNERSFVIDISVSAHTPQRATDLANAIASAYLKEQDDANANFNRRTSEAITSQLERMRDAVSQSEQAVAAYKAANNLVGSRDRLVTGQELDEANTQLTNAKTRLNEAQARAKLVESIESGTTPLEALPEAIQSNTIVQLRARAADASREEAQLAQVVGPNHPALQQARAQVRDVQAAIKNEAKLIAQSVRNAAITERINVQNLQARFDSLKELAQDNEKAMVPLRELERKADSNRVVYETYLARAKAASEQQVINNTNIRLVSRAVPPDRKSWPQTIPIMAGALFGGLFVGIVLALLRDALGRMRRPPTPRARRERAERVLQQVAEVPARGRGEQLSRLRAELLAAPAGHSILLVRASGDEALDLVALELAHAVEKSGQKVVVVDADLKAHVVSSQLGFDQRPGVRDILAGVASIREVAHVLGRTGITVVPVGTAALPRLNQQMRSELSAALDQARAFGRVIIDGGELGSTLSGSGLYAMADEVVFLKAVHGEQMFDASGLVDDLLRHCQIKAKAVFIDPASHALTA